MYQDALDRATNGHSVMNINAIITGFLKMGVRYDDIKPRENIFTYNAWKALGRQVKRGQHGVKILSFVPMEDEDGNIKTRARTTTVFHISQTEEQGEDK